MGPPSSPSSTSSPSPSGGLPFLERSIAYLRRHPILCLALMTPGFAEYTSGSSAFANLVLDPAWFFLQVVINVAMYTSGALLVREAMIRWNKGWPTAFALAAAYAIMEEGISDQTIFTPSPKFAPLGAAGVYGHFAGIDWTWLPDIFVIHILLSITLPLLLLSYALPETRGRSLLTLPQVRVVLVVLAADSALVAWIGVASEHFYYGTPLLLASLLAIVLLCLLGRALPRDAFAFRPGPPTASRLAFFVVGAITYPLEVFFAVVGNSDHLSPPVVFLLIALTPVLGFWWFVRNAGTVRQERHIIVFTAGLLTFGMIIGLATQFPFEFVIGFDAAILYFFWRLDRHFARAPAALRGTSGTADPPSAASRAPGTGPLSN